MAAKRLKIPAAAQSKLVKFATTLLSANSRRNELRNKMTMIDQSYARYTAKTDIESGNAPCGDLFEKDKITAPITVSQVDSLVGYLADVFLSGYPIFPVVSTPANRAKAEQLEALIDDHALLGGYARQLLMFFRDGTKYNLCAIEADWDSLTQLGVADDWRQDSPKVNKNQRYMTVLNRLDPYNLIFDECVSPADVAEKGDYAGYLSIVSRTQLKRLLNKWTASDEVYNASEAMTSSPATGYQYYTAAPSISDYVSANAPRSAMDWDQWFAADDPKRRIGAGQSELFTLYARIIPSDMGIIGPEPNTPQIWKLVILNGSLLIHARRIVSAYDRLPILIGQPLEDGFGIQTQSVAESQIPIQNAATTLFNMRFAAARRAVSDRALYDPTMIDPAHINSPAPAPKIPVKSNPLNKNGLAAAYHQIPFDMRGTETAFQDAAVLVDFSKQLSGLNNAQQGQFQKGNKSVQEWTDTMGSSDSRLRLPALCLEYQVFVWLKFMILLNLYQYGEDEVVVSQRTGEQVDIKMDDLRREVLAFKVADGFTPKARMASVEMLTNGMNLLMNSPILQQAYGTSLPAMYAHMMQLGGVRGLDEYSPERQQQQMQQAGVPAPTLPAPVVGAPPEGLPQ